MSNKEIPTELLVKMRKDVIDVVEHSEQMLKKIDKELEKRNEQDRTV